MGEGKSKVAGKVAAATAPSSNSSVESWQYNVNPRHKASSNVSKVALLIGVSEYEFGFSELPGAVKDAQAMRTVLSSPSLGQFNQVLPLLENPDSYQMQQAMDELFADRDEDELVLLYFSGHGLKDVNNRLYLGAKNTSRDTHGNLVDSSVVAASFIHKLMNQCRSKRQVIILDCCFSGAFPKGFVAKDDTSIDIRSQLGGKGRVILSSSGATQLSFSGSTSVLSPYTQYLIEGMCKGKGCVRELHQYVTHKIQAKFPKLIPEIHFEQEGENICILEDFKFPINTKSLMSVFIDSKTISKRNSLFEIARKYKALLYVTMGVLVILPIASVLGCKTLHNMWVAGGPIRARYNSSYDKEAPEKQFCKAIGIPIDLFR